MPTLRTRLIIASRSSFPQAGMPGGPIRVKWHVVSQNTERFDIVIVGGGPAGLAAGLYAARMRLRAVLVERGALGGQLLNTELIEDYPGFESVLGQDLAVKMGDH